MSFKLEKLMGVRCLGATVRPCRPSWGGYMKGALRGEDEEQPCPSSGWGQPRPHPLQKPPWKPPGKPPLPSFIPSLFFEVWLYF